MRLEAMMVRTWSPSSSEFGGRNRARLDEYWEAVYGWRAGC